MKQSMQQEPVAVYTISSSLDRRSELKQGILFELTYLYEKFKVMASKRTIKKQLNGMIFDIVDECFSLQLYKPSTKETTNKLIDEALDYRDGVLASIHQAKSKKDFPAILANMEDKGIHFVESLNDLQY